MSNDPQREEMERQKVRVDFLVGNAPPVPKWFKPIMPHPRPAVEQGHHSNVNPLNHDELQAWDLLRDRERDLQWPLWWALEQIKRIDKPRPAAIEFRDREPGMPDSGDWLYRVPYTMKFRVVSSEDDILRQHCKHGRSLHANTFCKDCESEIANDTRRVQLSENTKAREDRD